MIRNWASEINFSSFGKNSFSFICFVLCNQPSSRFYFNSVIDLNYNNFQVPYVRNYNPCFIYFLPNFEDHFFVFRKVFFRKLCLHVRLVFKSSFGKSRFLIKSELWWCTYGSWLGNNSIRWLILNNIQIADLGRGVKPYALILLVVTEAALF